MSVTIFTKMYIFFKYTEDEPISCRLYVIIYVIKNIKILKFLCIFSIFFFWHICMHILPIFPPITSHP